MRALLSRHATQRGLPPFTCVSEIFRLLGWCPNTGSCTLILSSKRWKPSKGEKKKKLGRRPTCQTRMHTVLGFKLLMGRVYVCLFCSPHLPQIDTKETINSIVLLKPTSTLGSYCIFRNSSVFCLFPPPTQDCGVKSKF